MLELGAGAAALLGGVAGQLDAVDGEHLAPDQALRVTDQEHLLEHFANQLPQARDEGGDGGEVRAGVPAQSNEGDVIAARAFDGPAGDDAPRVGQQHDLEQHGRGVRTRAGVVVGKARVKAAEVDLVIEQVVQRVLECSGQQLGLQVHGQKARAGVDRLVASHRRASVVAMHWPCNRRATRADCGNGFSTASLGVIGVRAKRQKPALLSFAGKGQRNAPNASSRRLVLGRNSWESSPIQAREQGRPRHCSRQAER